MRIPATFSPPMLINVVQLTSAYSGQTFSFEVIGHHIFNGRYCVHGVRPGAGVNSVFVSHAHHIISMSDDGFHREAYTGSLVRPDADGN